MLPTTLGRRAGLSPRVRGNRECVSPTRPDERSIPACAGEPAGGCWASSRPAVYPRVCGGTRGDEDPGAGFIGLSPRVRGNPAKSTRPAASHRSIPACAGEPGSTTTIVPTATVYPRVCGGTVGRLRRTRPNGGLSPRVRGNRYRVASSTRGRGSIPACAGEPKYKTIVLNGYWVYPRVCGGTLWSTSTRVIGRGLSPRVRGNLTLTV